MGGIDLNPFDQSLFFYVIRRHVLRRLEGDDFPCRADFAAGNPSGFYDNLASLTFLDRAADFQWSAHWRG